MQQKNGEHHTQDITEDHAEQPAMALAEIEIDAQTADVWKALTTEGGLAGWFGEGSMIGAAPGENVDIQDIVTGEHKRGRVDDYDVNRQLRFTWWTDGEADTESQVTITLSPSAAGTRVTVTEKLAAAPPPHTAEASAASMAAVGSTSWLWRLALLMVAVQAVVLTGVV